MSQVMNIRQYPSLKGKSKAGGPEAQVSTPLMRLKLQKRTITPTLTPDSNYESSRSATFGTASGVDEAATVSAVDDWKTDAPQQNGQAAEVTIPKLTLVQMPLLPKPGVARPTPPADPKSVLHRLHGLREAGDSLLAQTQAMHVPGPSPHTGISTGAVPSDKAELAPPSSSNCRLQGSVATTTSQGLPFRSSCTSSAAVASPYSRNPAPGARRGGSSAGITTPQPCLSTPSLVGLRDQEHKDTGGGFLTHFADPRDLCTPSHGGGGAAAGGLRGVGDTAAGGSTTPLSMLRSIHRLQQLQRLQREGAQLVAAIDASEAAVLGA